jgi:branched-chain amino acid transport system permease protein
MKWLIAPALLAAVAAPWLADPYTTATLARILVLGLVAASVALLTGVAGLPTLGQTAPFAAGAYAAAHTSSVGVVQLLTAACVGAAFAALTTPLVVYARGVVVLMITLAIGELAVTAASRWRSVTGGTDGLAGMASPRPLWGLPVLDTDRARYLYALAVVGIVLCVVVLLLRGPAGMYLRGCRDDEARMRASGHPVNAYLAIAYIAAGAIAGLAGSLLVTTQQYLSPADFGFDIAALLLLGVVIGGAGSVVGAIAGTAVVLAARDWLSGLLPGRGPLLLGALFIVAAYALPRLRFRLRSAVT